MNSILSSLLTRVFLQAANGQKRKERDEEALANVTPPKVVS